jgi:hypothetical protein
VQADTWVGAEWVATYALRGVPATEVILPPDHLSWLQLGFKKSRFAVVMRVENVKI